jgi:hypothetical protein
VRKEVAVVNLLDYWERLKKFKEIREINTIDEQNTSRIHSEYN